MRLLAALGRRCERFTWMPVRYEGRHLQACLPGTVVTVDGRPLELSRRESELLGLLLAEANHVVQREVLIAEIWGYETRSLDVYVRRLRRKLGAAGAQIETITGIGYRFAEPATRPPRSASSVVTSQSHRLVTDS
ncbi:MAG: winged helix-turn-helix domain-containing protein [Vicinamibacterales bacterium]